MTVELFVVPASPVPAPMSLLRERFPDLFADREYLIYRSLDFSVRLREVNGVITVGADGRLDAAFWCFVRALRDTVGGEVRDGREGRALALEAATPPLALVTPALFAARGRSRRAL